MFSYSANLKTFTSGKKLKIKQLRDCKTLHLQEI